MDMIRTNSHALAPLETHRDIICRWPSLAVFADDIGVSYEAAKKMSQRRSIGREHWLKIVDAALRRGIDGISVELIARTSEAAGASA